MRPLTYFNFSHLENVLNSVDVAKRRFEISQNSGVQKINVFVQQMHKKLYFQYF